ncbi:uncharacterized protein [Rutidosis leptorrhynchoides]|uniref:uncharacterized protein n=1 Tax=Rutidosis leptorrhynchoides TaxID=125765 RepID=UPI003A99EE7F
MEKEKSKSQMLKQKARIRWVLEGDENLKFFHSCIRRWYNKSNIRGLLINGVWNDDPGEIKNFVFHHFKDRFSSNAGTRPVLSGFRGPAGPISSQQPAASANSHQNGLNLSDGLFVNHLTSVTAGLLEEKFCENEEDLLLAIDKFWESGVISRGCNASFITLVPKKSNPDSLNDYRPISLIGSYYKIIAKLLSNRLRRVIPNLVGFEQSAFIKGRNILDGALIASESLDFLKRKKARSILFKVDFEKAFDFLSWDFLLEIMEKIGFGSKWRMWIMTCLKSASVSVLINGSPTEEFSLERGVRQGDPLSPFLFILAAEGLNLLIKEAVTCNLFKGVEIGDNRVPISHLQYADDTIFFGIWDLENIRNLMKLLKCFERTSGLKTEVESVARIFGCNVGEFPFTYLGLPIGANMSVASNWKPVVDKIGKRLADWKARTMSFGGPLTLVKSVLNSLPLSSFSKVIGNGSSTNFWKDHWLGDFALEDKFKRLVRLESNMEATVRNRLGIWEWIREPRGRALGELSELNALFQDVILIHDKPDTWKWVLNGNGVFSTKKLTELINEKNILVGPSNFETIRNNLVPSKVEIFVWRARRRRLAVLSELDKKGIDLHSVLCPICGQEVETVEHSLVLCNLALDVWEKVSRWWGLGAFTNLSINEIFMGNSSVHMSEAGRKIWQATLSSESYIDKKLPGILLI